MKPPYAKILQTLYDHELSFTIESRWDSGFKWIVNLVPILKGSTHTLNETIEQMWSAVLKNVSETTRTSLLKSLCEVE